MWEPLPSWERSPSVVTFLETWAEVTFSSGRFALRLGSDGRLGWAIAYAVLWRLGLLGSLVWPWSGGMWAESLGTLGALVQLGPGGPVAITVRLFLFAAASWLTTSWVLGRVTREPWTRVLRARVYGAGPLTAWWWLMFRWLRQRGLYERPAGWLTGFVVVGEWALIFGLANTVTPLLSALGLA